MPHMTVGEARSFFTYNPSEGVLRWRRRPTNSRKPDKTDTSAGYRGKDGRIQVRVRGRLYKAHQIVWLLMTSRWPGFEIDHRDGDPSNNRWSNLRRATRGQNCKNTRPHLDSKSGLKGIHWYAGKWSAQIMADGRRFHLGRFDTPEEAHAAYCEAAARLHGEFARVR